MSSKERRHLLSTRTARIAVPTVAALGAGGAFAVAAIPGSDGTLTGCYVSSGLLKGNLRVVDDGTACARYETQVKWNQKGPAGPDGPAGPIGPQGPAGANGSSAILIGGEALNTGRAQAFLGIDGIKGESTDAKHPDDIDLKSFSFGVKNANAGGAGGGGGSSKAEFSTFHFNKLVDVSSPALLGAVATGKHFPSATFSFRRPGTDQNDFLTVKLSDVFITDYHQGGTQEPPLLEDVALSAAKMQVSYAKQNPDGSAGSPVTVNLDIGSNKGA